MPHHTTLLFAPLRPLSTLHGLPPVAALRLFVNDQSCSANAMTQAARRPAGCPSPARPILAATPSTYSHISMDVALAPQRQFMQCSRELKTRGKGGERGNKPAIYGAYNDIFLQRQLNVITSSRTGQRRGWARGCQGVRTGEGKGRGRGRGAVAVVLATRRQQRRR